MPSLSTQLAAHYIRGEYLSLPGLSLTPQQVQRLYSLDALTCEAVLTALVDIEFLTRNEKGRYVRSDLASGPWTRVRRRSGRVRSRAA